MDVKHEKSDTVALEDVSSWVWPPEQAKEAVMMMQRIYDDALLEAFLESNDVREA